MVPKNLMSANNSNQYWLVESWFFDLNDHLRNDVMFNVCFCKMFRKKNATKPRLGLWKTRYFEVHLLCYVKHKHIRRNAIPLQWPFQNASFVNYFVLLQLCGVTKCYFAKLFQSFDGIVYTTPSILFRIHFSRSRCNWNSRENKNLNKYVLKMFVFKSLCSRPSANSLNADEGLARRKNTSFKITNILPSRPPSNDPDESGEDDPDDSR